MGAPPAVRDHDVPEVVERADHRVAPHQQPLGAPRDGAAADRDVVALEGGDDLAEGHVAHGHALRVDGDLVGAKLAAEDVDVDDAGDQAKPRGDLPVEDGAQLHGAAALAAHLELVDLPESRRERTHLRDADLRRHLPPDAGHALVDPVASDLRVDVVLEDHGDRRDAVARERAQLLHLGDAAQGHLHRGAHQPLDVQRPERGGRGEHLHLDVGEVGHRVDGQRHEGPHAERDEHHHAQQHRDAVANARRDDPGQHRALSPPRATRARARRAG